MRQDLPYLVDDMDITGISADGRAIGKKEGLVYFVEGAVPGDTVRAEVFRKKKNLAEARVIDIRIPSADRVQPRCEHFGLCGGCKWQHMSYNAQLLYKTQTVKDAFSRIGKFDFPEPIPIVGNEKPYHYRNKLEFTFSARRWLTAEELAANKEEAGLGFHLAGRFDKVLDLRNCYLLPEPGNSIRKSVREYQEKHKLSCFDIRAKKGFLRTLMIRMSNTGEIMVLLTVFEADMPVLEGLLDFLKTRFPQITSLLYAHNPKGNDTLADLDIRTFSGKDHMVEEMEGLQFRISPRSFFQTNSAQALQLYRIAREFAGLGENDLVYDLYTGTGTIANFIARSVKRVIGVDYSPDSIQDASANSALNKISNAAFFAGDMKKVLVPAFFQDQGRPDVIITDPPRAGMEEKVIASMISASPRSIVYISCNPSTQARDIGLLSSGYRVKKIQPVDMFPQTAHVENVVLLERIN
jgi:23S rRNA (uracil1939-C5)-methyltransferase